MDRTKRKINKQSEDLNNTVSQIDVTDIYRTISQQNYIPSFMIDPSPSTFQKESHKGLVYVLQDFIFYPYTGSFLMISYNIIHMFL